MKKLNSILASLLVCLFLVGCSDDDSNLGGANADSGWIEFDSSSSNGFDYQEVIEIPFSLPYGINQQGQDITYSIELVSGSFPAANLGTFTTTLEGEVNGEVNSGKTEGTIDFVPANSGENYELKFTLLSTTNTDYQIGLSDGSKQITHNLFVCHYGVEGTYAGDGYSDDLSIAPGSFPAYTVDFVPVAGEDNMWTLTTTWGPDFVTNVCGGCVAPGAFPYPSTVTLLEDNSVIVTSTEGYATGGTGTYDICSDTFTLNISQELFANTFTADVVLTGM